MLDGTTCRHAALILSVDGLGRSDGRITLILLQLRPSFGSRGPFISPYVFYRVTSICRDAFMVISYSVVDCGRRRMEIELNEQSNEQEV